MFYQDYLASRMSPEQIALLTKRAASGEPAVTFEFRPFMPGAAGDITGADMMYQNQLRKRGILAHPGSHARFDVFGMGMLMVLRLMSDRGGPKAAATSKFAMGAGYGIAWHALAYREAYAGAHEQVLLWDAELGPKIEAWQAGVALLREERDFGPEALAELDRVVSDPTLAFNGWTAQATWLRTQMFKLRRHPFVPAPRFALWLPNGEFVFRNSIDAAFTEKRLAPILAAGPLVVLDQEALGEQLYTNMRQVTGDVFVTVHIGT
jgi:hypothetical protein